MRPFPVKILIIFRLHVPVHAVTFDNFLLARYSLLDHFATFVVKGAFMGHFLVASVRILVHLVPFSDFVPFAIDGTLGFGLVGLLDGSVLLHLGHGLDLSEPTIPFRAMMRIKGTSSLHYITLHAADHVIDIGATKH